MYDADRAGKAIALALCSLISVRYTFNRIDRRLERLQELALFVFEALAGLEDEYDYSVVCHSGNGPEAEEFVKWGGPSTKPKTPRDRWRLCQAMAAHAQYCSPGDHTLDGTAAAIANVARLPADERFVFLISDADLKRYGISPARWNDLLTRDPRVQAFVLLISSNEREADDIKAAVDPGRAYVCFDAARLAATFKEIFAARVLKLI